MALEIVRHDITRINADAIVNSTNRNFVVGGLGVDASIHYAAGPKLKEALNEIGSCPLGSSVITDSFNIPSCKYIIHTVTPRFIDGGSSDRELLQSCYRSVLSLAVEHNCKSIAIPLLSAGSYGYPKAEAYRIATSAIRDWIVRMDYPDLDIFLVLYDKSSVELGKSEDSGVQDYITDNYTESHKAALRRFYVSPERRELNLHHRKRALNSVFCGEGSSAAVPVHAENSAAPNYADVDLSFAEMCEWWCDRKGIRKGQFFTDSNITRATFSNIKLHPDRSPKKNTVFACAIGLKLDIDEAKDLLMRAGMAFSKHYPTDRLVEEHIRSHHYDIDEINYILYEMDLMGLGYSRGGD